MRTLGSWLAALLLAGLLLVLLPAPSAQAATAAVPPRQDPPVCPTVAFTKTVAVTADACALATTQVEISAGTPIYYCYQLTNSISDSLTLLALLDGDPPVVVPEHSGSTLLAPGETSQALRGVPSALQPAITATSITTATWNFLVGGLGCNVTSNPTTVTVVRPSLEMTLRVAGAGADPCTVTNAVNNIGSSSIANYCLIVSNVGNATFQSLLIDIPQLGIDNRLFNLSESLTPGITARLTSAQIPQLQRTVREPEFTAEARVVGQTDFGQPSDPVFNAATSRSAAAISVRKVVTRNANGCPDNSDSPLIVNQPVYLCYIIVNNGPVELLQHSFTDFGVNVSASFATELPVNGTLRVNNTLLQGLGGRPVLGPFAVNGGVNGSVTFVAQNQALGFRAQSSGASTASVVTPTPGPTDQPTPTNTPLIFPTSTPLPTLTPLPPTPTPTPTWTPAPTWTPPPTAIIFTTPSRLGTPYPAIGGGQPPASQPVDPFAATATAAFLQSQGDPFGATATAVALQAQNNLSGYPAPADPFAATATAIFMQSQGDPFGATATANALLAQSSPAGYPAPAATPTPAAVAVAPPPVIVTPTPDPNVTLAPTVRPVAAATPAPAGNWLALLASALDSAVATLTFLGLLAGAGLFFVAAAVLIVLTVRVRRPAPYDLTADDAATFAAAPPAAGETANNPDDHWPASLS